MSDHAHTQDPSRILLIRPSALGDVARSVCLLSSLKARYPQARIDWLIQAGFEDVVAAHPALHAAVTFDRRGGARGFLTLLRRLRGNRYDLVIDAQGLLRSGIMALATSAARRVGHADAREGAAWCYTQRVPAGAAVHTVDRMLTLVEAAGAPALRDAEAQRLHVPQRGRAWLEESGMEPRGCVVLAPTSRWIAKQWPAERFAAVARALAHEGRRVILVGAASERGQIEPVLREADGERIIDLVGQTSVAGLMAGIEASALVIANDSAALHLAVGLHRPTIALFGPTEVAKVGPYGRESEVIQHVRPGEGFGHKDARNQRLMLRIEVDEVLARAREKLGPIS